MNFRIDIQALRGLAVLLVLFDHAKIGPFKGGYLGVDIFFVISGFLITRIITDSIALGNFSFKAFYWRRAKRILPASYATFLVTALLSPLLLNAAELQDYTKQLIGALTYSANIALYFQTGYFETASELKPLLHIWSLSIEEQYYMLLPAFLVFLPRRYWLLGTGVMLGVSFVACYAIIKSDTSAAFYWLPTRAWELAIGSAGTLMVLNGKYAKKALSYLLWPSVLALVWVPIFPIGYYHPGKSAIIVCLATLVILLNRNKVLNTSPVTRGLAKVGDISYSLYLVHWPIFAYLNNVNVGELSSLVNSVALLVALAAGYGLYWYVEFPCRHANITFGSKIMAGICAVSLAIVALPLAINSTHKDAPDYAYLKRPNKGLDESCDYEKEFTARKECSSSEKPKIMVWGDSFAIHLVPGIVATSDAGVIQATRSVCGPIIGLAPLNPSSGYPMDWSENCLTFNNAILKYLATEKSIETVVLSSPFTHFVGVAASIDKGWRLMQLDHEVKPDVALAVTAMKDTVAKIRALGKKVIVVAPPPTANFNIGGCLERKASHHVFFGAASDCSIAVADYHALKAKQLEFLKRIVTEADVKVVWFDEFTCSGTSCMTELDGTFLYRDEGHLSYDGSVLLAKKLNLAHILQTQAQ